MRLPEALKNCLSANLKLSKTHLHEIGQSRGFLGGVLEPLLKTELLLIKNLFKSFAKSALIQLGLPATVSATDADLHKERYGSGITILKIFDKEVNDVMKMVKYPEKFGFLIKAVSEKIQYRAKEQKGWFLSVLLGTLGATLLGNMLIGKRVLRAGEGTTRGGEKFQYHLIFQLILKYKCIIKINLMMFIQEIIQLKQRMGHMS